MALNQGQRDTLEEIAKSLEVISSWHSGPRQTRVLQVAEQVRGVVTGDVDAQDVELSRTASTTDPKVVEAAQEQARAQEQAAAEQARLKEEAAAAAAKQRGDTPRKT